MGESDAETGVGQAPQLKLLRPSDDPEALASLAELNQQLAQGLTPDLAKILVLQQNALVVPPQVENSVWTLLTTHYADQGLDLTGDPSNAHTDIEAAIDCEQFGLSAREVINEYNGTDWVSQFSDEQYPREFSGLERSVPFSSFVNAAKFSLVVDAIKKLEQQEQDPESFGTDGHSGGQAILVNRKRIAGLRDKLSATVPDLWLKVENVTEAIDNVFGNTNTARKFKERGEFDLGAVESASPMGKIPGDLRLDTLVKPRRVGN